MFQFDCRSRLALLNDRITDIKWCLPPCYNPYHCFPICDETCCDSPPNTFESTSPILDVRKEHSQTETNFPSRQKMQSSNEVPPYIVYNYIVTTPEDLTRKSNDILFNSPHEINAFTSQIDPQTGNILCGPYCSSFYCLPSCLQYCCNPRN